MIYDYNHYNDPKKGNKHIYAFGERYESIEYCGFIHADTKKQAQTVLNAHNRKWVSVPYRDYSFFNFHSLSG